MAGPQRPHASGRPWIRPLPERLVNKIAAGEVVERPASVVKELVENSLDAGADRIDIIIEQAGAKLIKIVDNGCGIGEEQIEIAFARHATSKIADFADLDRIVSYGFRGEALPSIASVSRLRMVSRPADADHATEIVIEGGVVHTKKPASGAVGTIIEVENLFFNTPARRKFLKTESTESRHITRVVTALALARSSAGFSYTLNGRNMFAFGSETPLSERAGRLLSPGKKMVNVSGEEGPVTIEGYVGMPEAAQSNRNGQYLFINGRVIQSPTLAHAFMIGYGELLPKGTFPVGALLLSVDPTEVDVNVHPAKTEVRLSREKEIHSAIRHIVKESLRREGVIPDFQLPSPERPMARDGSPRETHRPSWSSSNVIPGVYQRPSNYAEYITKLGEAHVRADETPESVVRVDTRTGEIIEQETSRGTPNQNADRWESGVFPDGLRYVGRFKDTYLLFESGDDLLVIDQHTAHERVLFEEWLRRMNDQGGVAQQMLLPVQVELSADQMSVFEESVDMLNRSGFSVGPFGGTTVRIEAVPSILSRKGPEKAFRGVLDDVMSLKKTGYDLKKAVAQSVACRSAVMRGDRLSDQAALALVHDLLKCENRYSCPHGRPTFVRIARGNFDKQFGRE